MDFNLAVSFLQRSMADAVQIPWRREEKERLLSVVLISLKQLSDGENDSLGLPYSFLSKGHLTSFDDGLSYQLNSIKDVGASEKVVFLVRMLFAVLVKIPTKETPLSLAGEFIELTLDDFEESELTAALCLVKRVCSIFDVLRGDVSSDGVDAFPIGISSFLSGINKDKEKIACLFLRTFPFSGLMKGNFLERDYQEICSWITMPVFESPAVVSPQEKMEKEIESKFSPNFYKFLMVFLGRSEIDSWNEIARLDAMNKVCYQLDFLTDSNLTLWGDPQDVFLDRLLKTLMDYSRLCWSYKKAVDFGIAEVAGVGGVNIKISRTLLVEISSNREGVELNFLEEDSGFSVTVSAALDKVSPWKSWVFKGMSDRYKIQQLLFKREGGLEFVSLGVLDPETKENFFSSWFRIDNAEI